MLYYIRIRKHFIRAREVSVDFTHSIQEFWNGGFKSGDGSVLPRDSVETVFCALVLVLRMLSLSSHQDWSGKLTSVSHWHCWKVCKMTIQFRCVYLLRVFETVLLCLGLQRCCLDSGVTRYCAPWVNYDWRPPWNMKRTKSCRFS